MNNTVNLGNDFVATLKEKVVNFNNWATASTALLNAKKSFNKTSNYIKDIDESLIDLGKSEIKQVNTIEIDLVKEGIDVSEWEESIKPVKVIMSIMTKDNGGNVSIEIGNMIMLMEDGTFRINQ